ncbi:MAG TPA: CUAEP/CCAEP-tail radical SAM protein, partial [Candidatus Dormibacteraeota bacterium]|nr:CUAEP/CCAEP-tail radical SAM protein [Candidatus Dormibacteraeota bacterium]
LVPDVAPVQYAIRLLVPAGSGLLELDDVRALAAAYDPAALCHPWTHPDPAVDRLHRAAVHAVTHGQRAQASRAEIFAALASAAVDAAGTTAATRRLRDAVAGLGPEPSAAMRLTEPWFC